MSAKYLGAQPRGARRGRLEGGARQGAAEGRRALRAARALLRRPPAGLPEPFAGRLRGRGEAAAAAARGGDAARGAPAAAGGLTGGGGGA